MSKKEIDLTLLKLANEHTEESKEIYIENLRKSGEIRKKTFPKSNIKKEKVHPSINRKAILAGIIITSMSVSLGMASNHCSEKIYEKVAESGSIPRGLSIRDDSEYGKIVSYEDEYGNRKTIGGDELGKIIVEDSLKKDITLDEAVIACDWMGINASDITIVDVNNKKDRSTVLGRVAARLEILNEEMKEKSSEGRKR